MHLIILADSTHDGGSGLTYTDGGLLLEHRRGAVGAEETVLVGVKDTGYHLGGGGEGAVEQWSSGCSDGAVIGQWCGERLGVVRGSGGW
jgi:hypothetical protein